MKKKKECNKVVTYGYTSLTKNQQDNEFTNLSITQFLLP